MFEIWLLMRQDEENLIFFRMTLKGKQNHYNVKLLRGYGVSIRLKDSRIIPKNGQDDITGKSETEEWFVTQIPYEKTVISGRGYVSTEAIKDFADFVQILHNKTMNLI